MKRPASSVNHDSGTTRARPVKRGGMQGAAPGRMTGYVPRRKPVVKTYRGRLPVSGQERTS